MTRTMRQAFTEVDEILKYLPKEYIEKIPMKLRKLFSDCGLKDYKVKINLDKPLAEQVITYDAIALLTMLRYNYWCNSEEEKKKMEEQMIENDRIAKEKYDISALNKEAKLNLNNNLPAKVEKSSWFSKVLTKIKSIFKR